MIILFKLFESTLNNSRLNEKNPAKWKGKPFWIGIVDTLDGKVIKTWTYQKAESYDFHHSFYMGYNYLEKIKNEEYKVFWLTSGNEIGIESWDDLSYELKLKIRKQIEINNL
jgi:hypothetical protein